VRVVLEAHDPSHASVRVEFASQPAQCIAESPVVSLSPAVQTGPPGATASFAVSVRNDDSASCPPASIAMSASVPQGWQAALTSTLLSLAPGTTGQTTLYVTSPSGAPDGSYTSLISATSVATGASAGSGSAIYTVASPCVRALPALAASQSGTGATPGTTLTWSVSLRITIARRAVRQRSL
jgi:hypothetical protein